MGKQRDLTWHKARGVWKKKYQGNVYYVSKAGECKGPDDRRGYEKALLKWLQMKADIDGQGQGQGQRQPRVQTIALPKGSISFASVYTDTPSLAPSRKRAYSLAEVVEDYLKERRQQAESGDLSVSTYREARDKLNDFLGFAAHLGKSRMEQIDAQVLKAYRDAQLRLPPIRKADGTQGRSISPATARKRLQYIRNLMEWAYRNEYIDILPRNLDRKYVAIRLPEPTPTIFSKEEVQELFTYASQRTRLYIALGLNCGYGQTDIATLEHSHIDWQAGEIHRARNKTGSPQHHKLWRVTLQLLKAEMTAPSKSQLVLLDTKGNPLVVESLDATTAKSDPIGRSFDRARTRADNHREKAGKAKRWQGGNKGIKILRKTGAQWLEDNTDFPFIVKQYLGHKSNDVANHYRKESYRQLFDALQKMEKHFGLLSIL